MLLVAACSGSITAGGPPHPRDPRGQDPLQTGTSRVGAPALRARDLAPARARRLTATEIRNSVADIFFAGSPKKVPLLAEPASEGFANDVATMAVDIGFVERFVGFAVATSTEVVKQLPRIAPCDAVRRSGSACAAAFIASYGPRLYRRPLTAAESRRLQDAFEAAAGSSTYEQALEPVVRAMLLAPWFLYRTELGGAKDARGIVALTAHERAAALSYAFWQTTPDDRLLAAASSGALMTEAGMHAEVERLLADPRARTMLRSFVVEWLGIRPTAVAKTDPLYSRPVARAATGEAERLVDATLWRSDGGLAALLTTTRSYAEGSLAKVYDIDAAGRPADSIELPAEQQRSGILTLVGFIASHTPVEAFSPVPIAQALREKLLCAPVPPPPAGVPDPPVDPKMSAREKAEQHRMDVSCSGCHKLLDRLGFGLERYGVTGQYRTVEAATGAPLTGEGELIATDIDGTFTGAAELGKKLSISKQVRSCVSAHALSYLLGRALPYPAMRTPADQRAIAAVVAPDGAFAGGDVRKLLAALATSDAFVRRDGSALP